MRISDILRVKGNTLYTVAPDEPLSRAVDVMAEKDIGSLVVIENGELVGLLTFREVIQILRKNSGNVGHATVRHAMVTQPQVCAPHTELEEMRRTMLDYHARYMPVVDGKTLLGVVSFYDVAKAIADSQNLENRMLKAYISDSPFETEASR